MSKELRSVDLALLSETRFKSNFSPLLKLIYERRLRYCNPLDSYSNYCDWFENSCDSKIKNELPILNELDIGDLDSFDVDLRLEIANDLWNNYLTELDKVFFC